MSTNTKLPTPDDIFISVLLDEWLKDSHCLDSREAWDANPEKQFPFEAIQEYLCKQGLSDGNGLGFLMVQEAIHRISDIGRSADICPCSVVQAVGLVSLRKSERVVFAKERLVAEGLCAHEAEAFLRCVSLFLNVLRGDWPFEYAGTNHASDDKDMNDEGGRP